MCSRMIGTGTLLINEGSNCNVTVGMLPTQSPGDIRTSYDYHNTFHPTVIATVLRYRSVNTINGTELEANRDLAVPPHASPHTGSTVS